MGNKPDQSPLGKNTTYVSHYSPELLFPIPRQLNRDAINVPNPLPFKGVDIWNAYELSWLNQNGKPVIALGEIKFPCHSPYLVESKSLKLYLNSFNQSRFESIYTVKETIVKDLSKAAGAPVEVELFLPSQLNNVDVEDFQGSVIDDLDIQIDSYQLSTDSLKTETKEVSETLISNLVKSNCLVTGQPDWGSVSISYKGPQINREGLLRYIVSFRNHNEFAEQFCERVFMDILRLCKPKELSVYARYTRRGGLDINPYRSTLSGQPANVRQVRQ
jgi:7-cyano-7-deazaguanine reductase